MLRVLDSRGTTPPLLDLEMRWYPSERRVARSVRTAEGLCVVHWRGDEAEVALVVRGAEGEAQTRLRRDRADAHRVVELRLAAPAPAEPDPEEAGSERVERPASRAQGELLGADVDPLGASGAY